MEETEWVAQGSSVWTEEETLSKIVVGYLDGYHYAGQSLFFFKVYPDTHIRYLLCATNGAHYRLIFV